MPDLINKTIDGISWNFKSQIITQGVNFIVGLLLMRILVPDDFGRFAMVLVVISFLQIFRDAGLSVAIIQKRKLDEITLSSAFWFQIALAIIIAIPLLFFGSLFNSFYEETGLDQISFWLSIDFIIGGIGIIPVSLLKKELKFKELFKVQLLAIIVSSFIGVAMALNGFGYLSLVGKLFSWTLINSLGTFFFIKWIPKMKFSKESLINLLRVGLPDTGNHILWYLTMNVDDFFIGKVIGSTPLGFYNRAYTIMLLPMINISSVLQNVLFSTWSKMQNDINAINVMFLKVTGMIAFITFPCMLLLAIFAEPIIGIIFGKEWLPMANTLSILSIIGMYQSVSALIGTIYIVLNKNQLAFKINFVSSIFTIGLIIWSIYAYRSIEITSIFYGLVNLIILYPTYFFASKIMGISLQTLIRPLIYPLLFSLIIGGFGYLLFEVLLIELIILKLFLSISLSFCLYLFLCIKFEIQPIVDILKAIKYYKQRE